MNLAWHDCMDCGRSYIKVPHVCKKKDLPVIDFLDLDPAAKIEPPENYDVLKTIYSMKRDGRIIESPEGWFSLHKKKSE